MSFQAGSAPKMAGTASWIMGSIMGVVTEPEPPVDHWFLEFERCPG
jgi:hypothetical protein